MKQNETQVKDGDKLALNQIVFNRMMERKRRDPRQFAINQIKTRWQNLNDFYEKYGTCREFYFALAELHRSLRHYSEYVKVGDVFDYVKVNGRLCKSYARYRLNYPVRVCCP